MSQFKILLRKFVPFASAVGDRWGAAFSFGNRLFSTIEISIPSPNRAVPSFFLKTVWDHLKDAYARGNGLPLEILLQGIKEVQAEFARGLPSGGVGHLAVVALEGETVYLGTVGYGVVFVLRRGEVLSAARFLPAVSEVVSEEVAAPWVKTLLLAPGDRIVLLSPTLAEVLRPVAFRNAVPWDDLEWINQVKVPGAAGVIIDLLPEEGSPPKTFSLFSFVPDSWRGIRGRRRSLYVENPAVSPRNPGRSRLSIVVILLAMVLLGSVGFTLFRERTRVRNEKVTYLLSKVDENVKLARNLLDLDNEHAQSRVVEARENLEQARVLGASTGQLHSLEGELEEIERRLLKIQVVASRLVYDLAAKFQGIEARDLVLGKGTLLVLDSGGGRILGLTIGKNSKIENWREGLGKPLGLDFCDGEVLVWEKELVTLFDPQRGVTQRLALDPAWGVSDVACFGGSLYVLAPGVDQIFKGSIGANTVTLRPWLKDRVDLEGATTLGIDGQIYLWSLPSTGSNPSQSGALRCFLRGREVDFTLRGEIKNPLQKVRGFTTWAEARNIYLLDQDQARILRYSKQGEFLGQYLDPQWEDPQALAVSLDEQQGYVLAGGKIFEFDFEAK